MERLPYASFDFVLFKTTYGKTVINLQCHYYGIKTDASLRELPGNIRKCYGPRASQYQHLFVFFKHCLVSGTMTGFRSLKDTEQQQLSLDRQ